jgi:hypothetical protein
VGGNGSDRRPQPLRQRQDSSTNAQFLDLNVVAFEGCDPVITLEPLREENERLKLNNKKGF